MKKKPNQANIADYIPHGKQNAIHLQTLCELLGVGMAAIKAAVKRARIEGIPIVSGNNGYWISEDGREIDTFCQGMRKRARGTLLIVSRVGKANGEKKES